MAIRNAKKKRHGQDRRILLFLCAILSLANLSSCQSDAPRNIEIFYPFWPPPPPADERTPPVSPPKSPSEDVVIQPPPPSKDVPSPPSKSSKRMIFTAVAATAASAFLIAALVFFLFTTLSKKRRRDRVDVDGDGSEGGAAAAAVAAGGSKRFDGSHGNVKGYVVDEDGLDVLYWKKLSSENGGYRRNGNGNGNKNPAEVPRGRSSSSLGEASGERASNFLFQSTADSGQPPVNPPVQQRLMAVPKRPPPPPPPPSSEKTTTSAIPPPPPPATKPAVPPPRPPPGGSRSQESAAGNDQVKLKPLHWEKVNISRDQSNVWDKVERGSFQYNGDMMEALFGVAATKRKPLKEESSTSNNGGGASNNTARTFILDPRKSQNAAIVIKTLGTPHDELIEGLLEGKGLSAETLDKLTRIAVTTEEASQILAFNGDPSHLADAEFFLYKLLKSVPSAFTRANEMLFQLSYDSEILTVKESFQTLESACNDLKNRGIFLKLLEAILKAGNRLNAGTSRGNAKAFNLTTLRKLSDYKSSDGKTTLLHFVIHEVVRNEGKRCLLMRSNSLGMRQSAANASPQQDDPSAKEERENEYLKLGLPVVGGLSSEFSNVKKAASIDYDALKGTIGSLSSRVAFASELVANSASGSVEGGAFYKEMKDFLVSAELEIKDVEAEHVRVMEEVKKTTLYYQSSKASNDKNPLQLFVIVKDFLGMVDQACVEIARGVQQRKQPRPESGSVSGSESHSGLLRPRVTFPKLPKNFMSDKSSSGSDDES